MSVGAFDGWERQRAMGSPLPPGSEYGD